MRYETIDSQVFVENRKRFLNKAKENSIVIMSSNDVMPTNADGTMNFRQNNDLFFLTGVDQEETILLLAPNADRPELREVLFIRETNEHIRLWEGEKLTKEQARKVSGIQNVQWLPEFESIVHLVAFQVDNLYLGHNEHIKSTTIDITTREDRMIKWCKEKFPLHNFERAAKLTRDLRAIKSEGELDMLQKACDLTTEAFKTILPLVKPGMFEFEIEAELTYYFLKNRSRGHAFLPIVASGENACALHYVTNNDECKDGDLILMDFGAEYGNYNADITRCIPVNGKFSERQKEVYSAVLRCLKEGVHHLQPGNYLSDYEANMATLVENELVDLGILTREAIAQQDPNRPLYKEFFPHGTAHHLGLDVHDVGDRTLPIQEGMVFTCEPGIYIKEERIGIRLENDYVITKNGPVSLTDGIPIEIEDIENLMAKKELIAE